jgi:hypothetical protein
MLAECFARMDVRQMDLNKGDAGGGERIAQGHAGVGQAGRVNKDKGDFFLHCRLHPTDELMFGITLKKLDSMCGGMGLFGELAVNALQTVVTIVLRLAHTEQVEVRSIQDKYFRHLAVKFRYFPEKIGNSTHTVVPVWLGRRMVRSECGFVQ